MPKKLVIGLVCTLLLTPAALLAQDKKEPAKPAAQPTDKKPADKPAEPAKKPTDMPAKEKPAGAPQMSEAEMQAAMQAMTPGPAHQKLAKLAGDWTFKSKMIMAGAPAEESDGTAKMSMTLDGRFLQEENTGTMMGMPFKGTKIIGYNNGSKKYEGLWMYTLGTGMLTMNGASDDGGKTIKCNASFDNEIGVKESFNITYKFDDDDHFTVILDGGKMPDGSPGPTMEAKYTRKK